ncbi:MAG: alpha/beta hydrolase [Planctomycetota bacterium]
MPAPQNPVIVIPGITATCLRDDYELDAKRVWTALRTRYDDVALHPDDTRYERQLPARVIADQVFDIPYDEMLKDLRHDLSPHRRSPTPVYAFPYDWRQPLVDTEAQLADFIEEVIDRTSLMRHYHAAGYANDPKVDLVGHSMGGLVIAGYLGSHGGDGRVGKVATLGSPFRGSFEAVIKVTTGLSSIGGKSASR